MFKKVIIIIALQLLAMTVSADPTHDELKIVFKTTADARVFSEHYKLDTLSSYFNEVGVSEPSHMNRNIRQEYYLDDFSIDKNAISITIADEISYYELDSKVSLIQQLTEWSVKSAVNLSYESCGHFGSCDYVTISNGQYSSEPDTGIIEGISPSFSCDASLSKIESYICNSRQLSLLDKLMSNQYALLMASHTDEVDSVLKKEQIAWISKRNSCSDFSCIETEYKNRLSEIMKPYVDSGKSHEFHVILFTMNNGVIGTEYLDKRNGIPSWLLSRINSKDDYGISSYFKIYSLPAECEPFFNELDLVGYEDQLSSYNDVKTYQNYGEICD